MVTLSIGDLLPLVSINYSVKGSFVLNKSEVISMVVPAGLLVIAFGIWQLYYKPAPAGLKPAVIAQVSSTVAKEDKVDIPLPKPSIKAYKPQVKTKLKLPPVVIASPTQVVTASSIVPSSEHRTEVSAVLDTTTGNTVQYIHLTEDPWLAPEQRGSVSLAYGIKLPTNELVGRLALREDLVQIKGIHLGLQGTLDTDGEAFGGVGVSYRW
jgi:hypothetical protein